MKQRISFYSLAVLLCSLFFSEMATAQKIVDKVDISSEDAKVKFSSDTPSSYLVEIGGPDQYYSKQTVDFTTEISLSNINTQGKKFEDGLYSLQITPVYTLTEEQRDDLADMRANNDEEGMSAYRREHNLPDFVDVFSMNFSIRNGEFVIPTQQEGKLNLPTMSSQWELDHPSLYASVNTVGLDYPDYAKDNTVMVDQQILDDLIVVGSICVGLDCNNGESFGFDTERLKENNLRIHFQDTSNSASFPTNDWRIVINDTSNGGSNHFSVEDSNTGRYPFRIEAGARTNNLVVEADGDVGIKTLNPVVDLHIVEGNTPTVRLDQDGSAGFQSQIWDVAGNEANFFIRDVTNGSKLSFRIRPGAPESSIDILGNGNVGIGTSSASARLDVVGTSELNGNVAVKGQVAETDAVLDLLSDVNAAVPDWGTKLIRFANGQTIFTHRGNKAFQFRANDSAPMTFTTTGTERVRINQAGNVGIGTDAPTSLLEVNGTAAKPGGGDWDMPSDRKLKKNIKPFSDGLASVMKINPVTYQYNGKAGIKDTETEFVGILAQDIQKIAPFMVETYTYTDIGSEGEAGTGTYEEYVKGTENYLKVNATAIRYMLVNAVQEQQAIIEAQNNEINQLKDEVASLKELKAQVAELTQMVMKQNGQSN